MPVIMDVSATFFFTVLVRDTVNQYNTTCADRAYMKRHTIIAHLMLEYHVSLMYHIP